MGIHVRTKFDVNALRNMPFLRSFTILRHVDVTVQVPKLWRQWNVFKQAFSHGPSQATYHNPFGT